MPDRQPRSHRQRSPGVAKTAFSFPLGDRESGTPPGEGRVSQTRRIRIEPGRIGHGRRAHQDAGQHEHRRRCPLGHSAERTRPRATFPFARRHRERARAVAPWTGNHGWLKPNVAIFAPDRLCRRRGPSARDESIRKQKIMRPFWRMLCSRAAMATICARSRDANKRATLPKCSVGQVR
jgi:hypothetical protein